MKREAVRAAGARKSFNASIAEIVDFALGPPARRSLDS